MQIANIEGATRIIGEAQGYLPLPLRDVTLNDSVNGPSTPAMQTAWTPDVVERERISLGADIVLTILGTTHPPVMVGVAESEAPEAIDASAMPGPDVLVRAHSGQIMPAMFWFAIEGHDLVDIASEHGFDVGFRNIIDSAKSEDEAEALQARYEADPDAVLAEHAPTIPDGWAYGGKWHGEDGPVACFLRKREQSQ